MIIKALAELLLSLLKALLVIDLPGFPTAVAEAVATATTYLTSGLQILAFFLGSTTMSLIGTILPIIIAIEAFLKTWQFVWWVLSKIPMINVEG